LTGLPVGAAACADTGCRSILSDEVREPPAIYRLRGVTTWRDRILRLRAPAGEVALAGVLAAITLTYSVTGSQRGPTALLAAFALLQTLPLVVRRYRPLSVALVVAAATLVAAFAWHSFVPLGILVALYTLAARCSRRVALVVAGVLAAPFTAAVFVVVDGDVQRALARLALLAGAWIYGDNMRARRKAVRDYTLAIEDKANRLERERDEHGRRIAAETQAAIARDVHDLVGHSLSVIAVQAAAAGHIFERDPRRARRAVETIEATADRALDELRRVLGTAQPNERLAPAPQLEQLDDLLQHVRLTGLDATLTVRGEPRPLPAPLEVSAYRIIQEALTNTIRHAQAHHVRIQLDYDPAALVIAVEDDGTGPAAHAINGDRAAHSGLIGMRERAAAFDGTLEAGARPGGGFRIRARLPLAEPTA
jgi:signal transduction histidine kinase